MFGARRLPNEPTVGELETGPFRRPGSESPLLAIRGLPVLHLRKEFLVLLSGNVRQLVLVTGSGDTLHARQIELNLLDKQLLIVALRLKIRGQMGYLCPRSGKLQVKPPQSPSPQSGTLLAQSRPNPGFRVRLRQAMQDMSRSGTAGELRLDALIADLWWRVRLLNTDILEEEARAGVFDVQQPTYPLLAANLRARRDNLVSTIGVLEQRAKSVSEAA